MTTPILFLHGFPFNASSWKDQVEFFQDKHNVMAPDLRGHGNGPKGLGPWMIADYVDDLHELLVHAKVEKVVLCGLSMGGYVALEFIRKYPERVGALILCATRADADSNEAKDQRFKLLERIRKEGLKGFADDFSKKVLSEIKSDETREIKQSVEQMILNNSAADVCFALGAIASRKDSTDILRDIKCPTLVLAGTEDQVINWTVIEEMANEIPDAQFVKVTNAGHLINIEQPKKFNRIIDIFLNNHLVLASEKEMTNGYSNSATTLRH